MARRSDHTKEELQELIFQTALTIITSEGYEGLTARKLSKVIGYSPGTIYNIYKSMDDLCLHINAATLDLMEKSLNSTPYSPEASITSNLKAMAAHYLMFVKNNKERWLMLFTHKMPTNTPLPPWFRDKVENAFKPLESLIAPYYPNNKKEAHLAARALWASVHGICLVEQAGKMPLISNNSTSEMIEFLIDNLSLGDN